MSSPAGAGKTIVVGVDKALTMLRHCTGYFQGNEFVGTLTKLQVCAVQDGSIVSSDGDPLNVHPVMRVRGRYRDFANLETPTLGILAGAAGLPRTFTKHSWLRAESRCSSFRLALMPTKYRQPTGCL